jgi:hypothetical protein
MTQPHNYRICFDFAAESPRQAVIYLLGLISDPISQDKPFDWTVIDQATGYEHRIRCTFNELEKEAREQVKQFVAGLDPHAKD